MNLEKIDVVVEKVALSIAVCCEVLALGSPLLRKLNAEEEVAPTRIVFTVRDTAHVPATEPAATATPPAAPAAPVAPAAPADTVVKRKRSYTPYAEIIKKRATLIAQLEERYKNEPVHDCSLHAKGIVHRVNLPPCDTCKTLFLTLDACISGFDSVFITYLIYNNVRTSLFVTTRWINNNPQAMRLLCRRSDIFDVENHGVLHRPASVNGCTRYGIRGTENMAELVAEVEVGADIIERIAGVPPAFFRSGTAFADNVAVAAINDMGYRFIGFSVAADEGATLPRNAVKQRILAVHHGDIILMHFNSKNNESHLGFMMALEEMKQKKECVRFEKLRDFAAQLEAY
jgi:hypothetical protein